MTTRGKTTTKKPTAKKTAPKTASKTATKKSASTKKTAPKSTAKKPAKKPVKKTTTGKTASKKRVTKKSQPKISPLKPIITTLFWCTLFAVMGYLLFVKKINGHTAYHRITRLFQQDEIQIKLDTPEPVQEQKIQRTAALPIPSLVNTKPVRTIKRAPKTAVQPRRVTGEEKAGLNALLREKIE